MYRHGNKIKSKAVPKMPKAIRYLAEGSDLGELLLLKCCLDGHASELEVRASCLRSVSLKISEMYHRLRNNKAK